MNNEYQAMLEHHCHVIRSITEFLVVPIHYLALVSSHLLASWISAATLLAYVAATYGLHAVRVASEGSSPPPSTTYESNTPES
jgi:hypothetical protein